MSEQEQDAVIGRLVRECADAKRTAAAMKTELEGLHKDFSALADGLHYNVDPGIHIKILQKQISAGRLVQYDFSRLAKFLEEYAEIHKSVSHMESRLREFGIR